MNNTDSNSEQNDQPSVSSSLKLDLTANLLSTIADAIATLAVLKAIDEETINAEKEKQAQKELDDKLANIQQQIDNLTTEIMKMKDSRY